MTTEILQYKEWIIIGLIVLGFILMMMRGGKPSLFGQTVEIPLGDKKRKKNNTMQGLSVRNTTRKE